MSVIYHLSINRFLNYIVLTSYYIVSTFNGTAFGVAWQAQVLNKSEKFSY